MALRQAARRALQLQRPRVSLLPTGQRRRLVHNGGQSSLEQLDKRNKELSELYAGLAEMEKRLLGKYHKTILPGILRSSKNSELLGVLSKNVKPRPHDSDWRWFRGQKKFDEGMDWVAILGFFYYSIVHSLLPKDCK